MNSKCWDLLQIKYFLEINRARFILSGLIWRIWLILQNVRLVHFIFSCIGLCCLVLVSPVQLVVTRTHHLEPRPLPGVWVSWSWLPINWSTAISYIQQPATLAELASLPPALCIVIVLVITTILIATAHNWISIKINISVWVYNCILYLNHLYID